VQNTESTKLAQEHWNETPLFLSEAQRYECYPWLYEVAEFRKHSGERVLEIGCGTGCDLLQFAKHGAEAFGIDVTQKHLELARQRVAGRAEVRFGDATSIPFPDAYFDFVYSHGVLHHVDRPAAVVKEILRVLKPGGRFNIHVYAKWSYFPAALMLKYGRNWKNHIENSTNPVHIDLYTARTLRRLFPVPIRIRKHESPIAPSLLGWYLVVTNA
jgi:ubiquinone/menaquinone biosynthesis C-methylase UbiE